MAQTPTRKRRSKAETEVRTKQLDLSLPVEQRLMGAAEVARTLGVEVSNIDKQIGLPPHVAKIAASRIWMPDEIRAFAEERRRNSRNINKGGS